MRLPSFFSRGGSGRGGGARVLRAIRRPPMLQQAQASASADHVRRKTERAKRREESGSWKDTEALGQARFGSRTRIGLFALFGRLLLTRLRARIRPRSSRTPARQTCSGASP